MTFSIRRAHKAKTTSAMQRFGLTFLSSEQPFEQETCGTGHAQLPAKIAFRDDPDQRPVVVDYGQSALVGFQQKDGRHRAAARSV
jgi:hypothetical protein